GRARSHAMWPFGNGRGNAMRNPMKTRAVARPVQGGTRSSERLVALPADELPPPQRRLYRPSRGVTKQRLGLQTQALRHLRSRQKLNVLARHQESLDGSQSYDRFTVWPPGGLVIGKPGLEGFGPGGEKRDGTVKLGELACRPVTLESWSVASTHSSPR